MYEMLPLLPCFFMQLNGMEHSRTCVQCLQGDSLHRPCADGCNAFPGGRFHTKQPEGPVPFRFVSFLTLGNHIFLTQLYVNGLPFSGIAIWMHVLGYSGVNYSGR